MIIVLPLPIPLDPNPAMARPRINILDVGARVQRRDPAAKMMMEVR